MSPPSAPLRAQLEAAGVRPTSKRLALAGLLFGGGPRHVSAEEIWDEARASGLHVSLATIYNTLNGFLDAGLLRAVSLPGGRSLYDTNATPHHHVWDERTGRVYDLAGERVGVTVQDVEHLGGAVLGVDVLVRVRS